MTRWTTRIWRRDFNRLPSSEVTCWRQNPNRISTWMWTVDLQKSLSRCLSNDNNSFGDGVVTYTYHIGSGERVTHYVLSRKGNPGSSINWGQIILYTSSSTGDTDLFKGLSSCLWIRLPGGCWAGWTLAGSSSQLRGCFLVLSQPDRALKYWPFLYRPSIGVERVKRWLSLSSGPSNHSAGEQYVIMIWGARTRKTNFVTFDFFCQSSRGKGFLSGHPPSVHSPKRRKMCGK